MSDPREHDRLRRVATVRAKQAANPLPGDPAERRWLQDVFHVDPEELHVPWLCRIGLHLRLSEGVDWVEHRPTVDELHAAGSRAAARWDAFIYLRDLAARDLDEEEGVPSDEAFNELMAAWQEYELAATEARDLRELRARPKYDLSWALCCGRCGRLVKLDTELGVHKVGYRCRVLADAPDELLAAGTHPFLDPARAHRLANAGVVELMRSDETGSLRR